MELILKIVAGVVLGGLIFILLGYFLIKFLFWRLKRNVTNALDEFKKFSEVGAGTMIQTDIDLARNDDAELSADAQAAVDEFHGEGFDHAGVYDAGGGMMKLVLFARPSDSVWGAVTIAAITGPVKDVVSHHADGQWTTHTSNKDLGFKELDGITKVRVPDSTVANLLSRHLAERPEGEYQPATTENVVEAIKLAVRDEGLLRAWRGGIDDSEVQKNLQAVGDDTDEGQAAFAAMMARGQAISALDEAFATAFRETTTLPVARWEEIEDRLRIVHPLSNSEQLGQALYGDDADDNAFEENPGGETMVRRFVKANNALPPDKKLEHVGPVEIRAAHKLLRAEVFVEREWDDDESD
ncbi:MAG: hypothetical protein AAGI46_01680 [Planctomycetota bacterium]